jgi:hypothetical protein
MNKEMDEEESDEGGYGATEGRWLWYYATKKEKYEADDLVETWEKPVAGVAVPVPLVPRPK